MSRVLQNPAHALTGRLVSTQPCPFRFSKRQDQFPVSLCDRPSASLPAQCCPVQWNFSWLCHQGLKNRESLKTQTHTQLRVSLTGSRTHLQHGTGISDSLSSQPTSWRGSAQITSQSVVCPSTDLKRLTCLPQECNYSIQMHQSGSKSCNKFKVKSFQVYTIPITLLRAKSEKA